MVKRIGLSTAHCVMPFNNGNKSEQESLHFTCMTISACGNRVDWKAFDASIIKRYTKELQLT